MKFFSDWLVTNKGLLRAISRQAKERNVELYLVGGVLRDILLKKKKNADYDFSLKNGAIKFARVLAKKLGCGFVVLDEIHGCCRLVKKMRQKTYTLDFSDFHGSTLDSDLLHRDFSINSMAVKLEDLCNTPCDFNKLLIDPYAGNKDIKASVVRMVNKQSFDEDPLRILRAFSMAAIFDMRIEKKTLELIEIKKNKLKEVSSERIRDEFFKILSSRKGHKFLIHLDKYGILDLVIPEIKMLRRFNPGYCHLDVWRHSLETVKKIELLINYLATNTEIRNYLEDEICAGRRRSELLKFAALLHDIGKPKTFRIEKKRVRFLGHEHLGAHMSGDIGKRLKLSNEELRILKKIIFLHLRPGYMVCLAELSRRARFRFFRDADKEAVSVLLLSVADMRATQRNFLSDKMRRRAERLLPRLIREYFAKEKKTRPARLINGNDLLKYFKLEPSALIGKILKELEELQALGKIKTKAEALKIAAKIRMCPSTNFCGRAGFKNLR